MIRLATCVVVAAAIATALGCGGSSPEAGSRFVRYHDPSGGWTAEVPAGWTSVGLGPEFVRGEPLADPTRLLVRTYRNHSPAAALRALAVEPGHHRGGAGGRARGRRAALAALPGTEGRRAGRSSVELAVAKEGADAHVAALIARRAELERLVRTALLPALDSFASGSPDQPGSVLARTPPEPSYWPTAGWRTASPASQGMDGKRLDEMIAAIRAAKLPIDSVTVIRHGNVVLDSTFGPFAEGTLGEPYASGRLHELQSVTKSVSSMLLGIAMHEYAASGVDAKTPVVRIAASVDYRPEHLDARKRAMTVEDLLTMQSGLAWKESGYAYEPGSGNDVMAMFETDDWTRYVIDRPMATSPGTSFVYNTGAAHLVSAVVSAPHAPPSRRARREAAVRAARHPRLRVGDRSGRRDRRRVRPACCSRATSPSSPSSTSTTAAGTTARSSPPPGSTQSTTDHVADPLHDYGYLWWLDRADGYAYMAGLYGQLAAVDPRQGPRRRDHGAPPGDRRRNRRDALAAREVHPPRCRLTWPPRPVSRTRSSGRAHARR